MIVEPIVAARPSYSLAEPRVRPRVVAFFRFIAPVYFHLLLGFKSVALRRAELLVDAFKDFFDGKTRLLIAFRHPYGDEAQLLAYLIGRIVGREARRRGVRLARRPHAHFVHGYEVPLWAGAFERWLLPRVGAVPVYHTKFDGGSVDRIRALMKDGRYPIALSPEGQVSYASEELPRLEAGTARIGVWAVEDLAREKRPESVIILPLSVHYRWDAKIEKSLDRLIGSIERECGLAPPKGATRFDRLSGAADFLLAAAERYYSRFYGAALPRREGTARAERLADLLEAALTAAERALKIKADGDVIRRVYKIRQTGWDRIFRDDLGDPDSLAPLERALADRAAGEAWYASRHMEFVDIGFYMNFERLKRDDPLESYVETAQNYYDLASRLQGGNITNRIEIGKKRATVVVGKPISVTERVAAFGANRKASIEALNQELARSYAECIQVIVKERQNGRE